MFVSSRAAGKRWPWLSSKHVHSVHPSSKSDHHYLGPQKIMAWVSKVTFSLQLPYAPKIHTVIHLSLLKPVKPRPLPMSPSTSDAGYGPGPEEYFIWISWVARYPKVPCSIWLIGQDTTLRTVSGRQCQRCTPQLRFGLSMPINLVRWVHWWGAGEEQRMVSRLCSYLLKEDSVL